MRFLPAVLAVLLFVSGCERNAVVAVSEAGTPDASDIVAERSIDFERHSLVERLPEWKAPAETVKSPDAPAPTILEEINRQNADSLSEWQEYRSALDSAPRLKMPVLPLPMDTDPGVDGPDDETEDSLVKQVRDSPETLNWRMRITLLEHRLEAAGEDDRLVLLQKLEQAKESLEAAKQSAVE